MEATPELVSQDREAGSTLFREREPRLANTGRSFARRSGGWQQCRPPFLFGQVSEQRPAALNGGQPLWLALGTIPRR
jgi:hypothetical protein